jgi:hypothetical protein
MSSDALERHLAETPGLCDEARERIGRRLLEATLAPRRDISDPPRNRLARGLVGRWLVAVPLGVVLLSGIATLVLANRHAPRPSIVKVSAEYALADPGTPVSLSEFDGKTRRLFEDQGITGAWDLGSAAGRAFYQFAESSGHSCFGQAAAEREPVVVSDLACFAATSGLPGPVVDMSTVALDPTKAYTGVRLVGVAGIAASEVAKMRFTLTNGTVVVAPVVGDVYALPRDRIPPGTWASITGISRSGKIIWAETFSRVVAPR